MIAPPPGRWDPYVLHRDAAFCDHWQLRFDEGAKVAVIMGVGFDPRMCLLLDAFAGLTGADQVSVHAIRYEAPSDHVARAMALDNDQRFSELLGDRSVTELHVHGSGVDDAARSAAAAIATLEDLGEVTDVVVDVNAMPRVLFFPLIAKLLYLVDKAGPSAPNLHVLAADSAHIDAEICVTGIDEDAVWLHPFEGTFAVEATASIPRVWMPVLGENSETQLERISQLVAAREVCPVLPFPSRDPRRGDKLFEAYHHILFDPVQADSSGVVYADEGNPFQVYRRLRNSTFRYREILRPLDGCKTAYSAVSSKVVALGVLLAACELHAEYEVGVADIGAQTHEVRRLISIDEANEASALIGLTLSGDSYL